MGMSAVWGQKYEHHVNNGRLYDVISDTCDSRYKKKHVMFDVVNDNIFNFDQQKRQ